MFPISIFRDFQGQSERSMDQRGRVLEQRPMPPAGGTVAPKRSLRFYGRRFAMQRDASIVTARRLSGVSALRMTTQLTGLPDYQTLYSIIGWGVHQ